jgi:hypothetical protein
MRFCSTCLIAGLLIVVMTCSAWAQRQRGNNDERNGRNSSNEERGGRNFSRWGNSGGDNNNSGRSGSRNGGSGFNDQYGIITERNIFLRDRRSRDDERPRGGNRVVLTPEQTFVLTGVVLEDDEYHAYLEDVTRRTIQKMTVGTSIARGTIAAIDIDAIAYESNGKVTWINVGSNLTGSAVGSVSDERVNAALWSGSSTTAAAPGTPLPDANNPNLTMEERMRLRRAMEMNPGAVLPTVPQNGATSGQQPAEGTQEEPEQPVAEPQPGQPTPGAPGLSIEEQMRLRRQQELGR